MAFQCYAHLGFPSPDNLANKADRDQYALLCLNNTWKPVDGYKHCHLVWVPSHAVMARSVGGKEDLIWELLNQAQEHFGKDKSSGFQLFGSPLQTDLLFTDAAHGFLRPPPNMDAKLYLEYEYFSETQDPKRGIPTWGFLWIPPPGLDAEDCPRVQWCAVGHHERAKCKGEGDAMSLDAGFIYIAGKYGLVPVLAENYIQENGSDGLCHDKRQRETRFVIEQFRSTCVNFPMEGYYVMAVVKKSDADVTWNSLRGRKSCHTVVGTSASWNIPMGLIYNQTGSCKCGEYVLGGVVAVHSLCLCPGKGEIQFDEWQKMP
ncbi:hypothetical protein H8959_020902 [Pygathrix nigripes]